MSSNANTPAIPGTVRLSPTFCKGVTAAQAAAHIVPHVHTIWQLVLHMTAWKNEVRHRLSGAPSGDPGGGRLAGGRRSHARALARCAGTTRRGACGARSRGARPARVAALRADERYPQSRNGKRRLEYVLLHGLVQHDAYHAGQLAMLVKVVRVSRVPGFQGSGFAVRDHARGIDHGNPESLAPRIRQGYFSQSEHDAAWNFAPRHGPNRGPDQIPEILRPDQSDEDGSHSLNRSGLEPEPGPRAPRTLEP